MKKYKRQNKADRNAGRNERKRRILLEKKLEGKELQRKVLHEIGTNPEKIEEMLNY